MSGGSPTEGTGGPCWTAADLRRELGRFEEELRAAGLKESTVWTYIGGARRFVRWLTGGAGSAGAPAKPPRGPRSPLRGQGYLTWLRDVASIDQIRRVLREYEVLTAYDRSLRHLTDNFGSVVDLDTEGHRAAILEWLRSWGCRHLRLADEERTSSALLGWWRRWVTELPQPDAQLLDVPAEVLDRGSAAAAALASLEAAGRALPGGESTVRFGETAAAKALFILRPGVFLPWDEPIRAAFGGGSASGATYRRFLDLVIDTLSGLGARLGVEVTDLPRALGRPHSSPPKLVDEYLWVTITRGGGREPDEGPPPNREEADVSKKPPAWYGAPYGHYTTGEWNEAVERTGEVLTRWAREGRIGSYGELVNEVGLLDWSEGPYAGRGKQVGKLLGDVSVGEWLEDRPLLSALVVSREDGTPGGGFFTLYEELRSEVIGSSEDAKLRAWTAEVAICHEFWAGTREPGQIEIFRDDDPGYVDWLERHPRGFVINCEPVPKARYVILHRAVCRHISILTKNMSSWTHQYIKVCASERDDLVGWCYRTVGGPPSYCPQCDPIR